MAEQIPQRLQKQNIMSICSANTPKVIGAKYNGYLLSILCIQRLGNYIWCFMWNMLIFFEQMKQHVSGLLQKIYEKM